MKHAYLILAHNEFGLLERLLEALDDERNDIYVHIDRKVAQLPELHCRKAGLTMLKHRIDIRWAGLSMVEAEYELFERAARNGPYLYYHLLSGVDLPLKSQDSIHDFFDRNRGKEFIGYTLKTMTPELIRRTRRWHMFPEHFSQKVNFFSILRTVCLRIQEILGIERNRDINFAKGSQWVSISDDMVRFFLEKRQWVLKVFSHSFAPDECVVQTLALMSPLRDNIYNTEDDAAGCMRAIGWQQDSMSGKWRLREWCAADYDTLANSPALFARKFNSGDEAFISRILELSKR